MLKIFIFVLTSYCTVGVVVPPTPPGAHLVHKKWSQVSGPNAAHIFIPSAAVTRIDGMITGDYVFADQLEFSDSSTYNDTIRVNVILPP